MTAKHPRRSSDAQAKRLYSKIYDLSKAYIDEYGKKKFIVRNKKLCIKADVSYATMNSISAWYTLDEWDGVEWLLYKGKLKIDPEKYMESYEDWRENHD